MGGSADVTAVFSVPPFQFEQLKDPKIHTVLNSFDVMGPHTFTCLWTSSKFHDENPKTYKAVMAALAEATELVNKDRRAAAGYWHQEAKTKMSLDEVTGFVSGPQVEWTLVPKQTMKYAEFMHAVGSIKTKPAKWQDMFFPEAADFPGS